MMTRILIKAPDIRIYRLCYSRINFHGFPEPISRASLTNCSSGTSGEMWLSESREMGMWPFFTYSAIDGWTVFAANYSISIIATHWRWSTWNSLSVWKSFKSSRLGGPTVRLVIVQRLGVIRKALVQNRSPVRMLACI